MIKNDQNWQSVIMRKIDRKLLKMTQKGPQIRSKTNVILKYLLLNFQIAQKSKKSKVWPTDGQTENDKKRLKMTQNETKWHKKWIKMRQVMKHTQKI